MFPIRNMKCTHFQGAKDVNARQNCDFRRKHLRRNQKKKKKQTDIIKSHSRLEIFEHRIQMGEDENYVHPAMAITRADKSQIDDFTEKEKEKQNRYIEKKVHQTIPRFWPSRNYDTEDNKMSIEDTEKLKLKIQDEIDSGLKSDQNKKRIFKKGSPRKPRRPRGIQSLIYFYFDKYSTDDELTDFDF